MSDEFLMIRIDGDKKRALKERAFDLRLDGGMSELVMILIDKELDKTTSTPATASAPLTEKSN